MGGGRGVRSAIIPGLRCSTSQEVGKCIHDKNRGSYKIGTMKCYWKTEKQLWNHDSARNAEKGSGLWGNVIE